MNKTTKVSICVCAAVALLILATMQPAVGGELLLKPTKTGVFASTVNGPANAGGIYFDLTAIPEGATVDLAELMIHADVDTALGTAVHIRVKAATEVWDGSPLVQASTVAVNDTTVAGNFIGTGESQSTHFLVTRTVRGWLAGTLSNHGFIVRLGGHEEALMRLSGGGVSPEVALRVIYTE